MAHLKNTILMGSLTLIPLALVSSEGTQSMDEVLASSSICQIKKKKKETKKKNTKRSGLPLSRRFHFPDKLIAA